LRNLPLARDSAASQRAKAPTTTTPSHQGVRSPKTGRTVPTRRTWPNRSDALTDPVRTAASITGHDNFRGDIMTETASRQARRRFLKLATAGVAIAPLCAAHLARRARAQERVEEDEELAQQLGYKHDASEVDPDEWPDYEEGEVCANCQLYHGEEGGEWGPCDIFGGRLVHADGWCVSWLEKEA
jgi:hypothetical protein